ncbi:MAG: YbjQ family protein [Verrucomicrobia bacterium]|nr:YbjQ family protein [Verrucomicrobiota bacterium]
MLNPKDILVTTTSSIDGLKVKQYLKPISAHIVAGTNLFSDFFASFSDVFGGRSQTYQKQLTSLYNEAIERLRTAAYEIGANCIIGLHVDMDEISGKGKSMFMLTAMGTAVIIDDSNRDKVLQNSEEKFENVSIDKIKLLQKKREIIEKANAGNLNLEDDVWSFITNNQVSEVYDYVVSRLERAISYSHDSPDALSNFYKPALAYFDALPEAKKTNLLYSSIEKLDNEPLLLKLSDIIDDLQLLDLDKTFDLLNNEDFQKQKRAMKILTYDKPFYNKQDIDKLKSLIEIIKMKFPERGSRSMKKGLLSSKEKEVWTCECGKTNDIGSNCSGCKKDIYGFTTNEVSPPKVLTNLDEKISLITEYVE